MPEEKYENIDLYTKYPYRLRRSMRKFFPRTHVRRMRTVTEETQKSLEVVSNLDKIQNDFDMLKEQLLRTRADFDNYRKRMTRERDDIRKYAAEDLMKELLTTLDNFERAVEASKQTKDFDGLVKGIEMIHQHLLNVLVSKGLQKIEASGKKFNPVYHEAVALEERSDVEDQTVVGVLHDGYILNDRVIRPAAVKVSKKV